MTEPAVRASGLRKSYGAVEALAGVDLEVATGEVFALLGPNGAGKTTMVEILEGFRDRTAGDVLVLGCDPARHDPRIKARIGIVLQATGGADPHLTASETVAMFSGLYPHPLPVEHVLELAGLSDKAGERVRRLSGGQQRRLDVAVALAGDPDLLFLDEPTTGFDPSARRDAWGMIRGLAGSGKTIVLTTHYMDEAQELADRVAIISEGVIAAEGDPRDIAGRHRQVNISFRLPPGPTTQPPRSLGVRVDGDGSAKFSTADPTRALNELTGWALSAGIELAELSVTHPSLEDVYLRLTEEAPR